MLSVAGPAATVAVRAIAATPMKLVKRIILASRGRINAARCKLNEGHTFHLCHGALRFDKATSSNNLTIGGLFENEGERVLPLSLGCRSNHDVKRSIYQNISPEGRFPRDTLTQRINLVSDRVHYLLYGGTL